MLNSEFHPLAARELMDAVDHYESLAPGKGLELARQVKEFIHLICEFPESAPVTRGQVRSLLIQPSTRWHFSSLSRQIRLHPYSRICIRTVPRFTG